MLNDVACCGQFHNFYRWTGQGSWIRHPKPPSSIFDTDLVYDKVGNAIWTLAGSGSSHVYKYSTQSRTWQSMQLLPQIRTHTDSILCDNNPFIVTAGGLQNSITNTILLTNI